jgi:glutamyl-tRNA synthetase
MKTSGIPTYHFAHLIDDHLMGTTLVIRSDEWFASLPLHNQLFQTM